MNIIRQFLAFALFASSLNASADDFITASPVLGLVYEDINRDGTKNEGEIGVPGVRLVTQSGLVAETDSKGLFHISDLDARSSFFFVKVDEVTLPIGYELTTQNPQSRSFKFGVAPRLDTAKHSSQPEAK